MADEPLTIQAINWRAAFPFTNLFRAFRVAIHPSKVVLALLALLLLYVGGRVLDEFWPVGDRAVPGEIGLYQAFQKQARPGEKFSDIRDEVHKGIESEYAQKLVQYKVVADGAAAQRAAQNVDQLTQLKDAILTARDNTAKAAGNALSEALVQASHLNGQQRADAEKIARDQYNATVRSAYDSSREEYEQAKTIKNLGIFDQFFAYQANQISNVVRGVREWNWFSEEHISAAPLTAVNPLAPVPEAYANVYASESFGQAGVIQSLIRFFTVGPVWLLSQHPLYFLIFGAMFLVLWAIFGGAISRIAAIHIARDEKMSIRAALKFSISKFLSFLFAPIIPLLIVAIVGLLLALGALVGNIPFLGPIIVGSLFFIALAAGFVMALVLLGLIGGFNLMYPTIAVEGSDSFDAISRSFSYLYARPWRLAFYTTVSVVYGALTYLFVRLFIYLMLALTHKFVELGIGVHANSTAPLWSTMWPSPTTSGRLSYDIDFLALDFGSHIGAFLVSLWVYLCIAILGAFVISFYFSSNTIIYYLMRREVDATELDDVYVEQLDDEFTEPVPMTTPSADAPSSDSASSPGPSPPA